MIKIFLLLISFPFTGSAQQKKQAVEKRWSISVSPGIVPVPGKPGSVQPGIEFFFNAQFSLLNEIGLQTAKNNDFDSTALNKKYFKYKAELRYYIGENTIRPYFGLQFTTAKRKFNVGKPNKYYELFQDDSIYTYDKASINSPIVTATVQFGISFRVVTDFYFDLSTGYGARFVDTEYTSLVNLQKNRNVGFFNIKPISSYRYTGKLTRSQFNLGLRFSYRF